MENKRILVLEKRGCDFWNDEPLKTISDFGNYRLFMRFTTKENINICGDVLRGYVWNGSERVRDNSISFDLQYENQKGCWRFGDIYKYYNMNGEFFNSDSLLRIVNKISKVKFDKILIFNDIYNKITNIGGYREKNILEKLEHVEEIQKDAKYNVLRFFGDNSYFDYEINTQRITG